MELKIISFNIRFCDDPDGNSIAERAPRLQAVTAPYAADLIGLQEYRPAWEEKIQGIYGEEYEIFNRYRAEYPDNEGSPILWRKDRFSCRNTGYFWLSDTPEIQSRGWDEVCNCYRMCVYAVLEEKNSGKRFTVMNTHFGFGDRGQVASCELIHCYSQKIGPYPVILVGDFNMRPTSLAYRAMCGHFTDVNAVTARDWRCTSHAYHPETMAEEHIDYCFISRDIRALEQKIIDELVDGKYPSDHYGLYSRVELLYGKKIFSKIVAFL